MSAPAGQAPTPRRVRIAVAALLAVQGLLLLYVSRAEFVTADEPGYFAAGLTTWRYGALDLYRVNPPLARVAAMAPVLALDPAEDMQRWHPELPGARGERQVGQDVAAANGARYLSMIRIARMVTIAFTLLGGWLVFAWTRELWGARSALLSLAVWCFEPNVLAHGSLMTPDVPATVLGFAAMWSWTRWLAAPSPRRAAGAGVLLGLAILAKFTNLYLVVLWPALAWIARRRGTRAASWRYVAMTGAIGLVVIHLGYGCQGTLRPLGDIPFTSDAMTGHADASASGPFVATGNRFSGSVLGALPVPVPADFLRGLDTQRRDFEHRFASYLDGQWRDRGWWYYYLEALAMKVPLGTLALVLAGLALALRRGAPRSLATWSALLPIAIVLVLVSSQTGFNAHLRYVLPVMPFLALVAGRAAARPPRHERAAAIAVAVALVASIGSTARAFPDELAYFNELVGGPSHGDEHLLDSNLDWGQDALALAEWVDAHAPDLPLQLAYFGGADPAIAGLRYSLPPSDRPALRFATDEQMRAIGPHPGLFAISVNFTRGLQFEAPDGAGHWQGVGAGAYSYFRRFRPIASAGYSIRIYCIELDEANAVRAQLALIPLPPSPPVGCERFGGAAATAGRRRPSP